MFLSTKDLENRRKGALPPALPRFCPARRIRLARELLAEAETAVDPRPLISAARCLLEAVQAGGHSQRADVGEGM